MRVDADALRLLRGAASFFVTASAATAGKAKSPKSVATRAVVDRWDGLNITILERVTRAFGRANAVDPTVPAMGFVSLRSRTTAKGKAEPTPGKKQPTPGNGVATPGNDA